MFYEGRNFSLNAPRRSWDGGRGVPNHLPTSSEVYGRHHRAVVKLHCLGDGDLAAQPGCRDGGQEGGGESDEHP